MSYQQCTDSVYTLLNRHVSCLYLCVIRRKEDDYEQTAICSINIVYAFSRMSIVYLFLCNYILSAMYIWTSFINSAGECSWSSTAILAIFS